MEIPLSYIFLVFACCESNLEGFSPLLLQINRNVSEAYWSKGGRTLSVFLCSTGARLLCVYII